MTNLAPDATGWPWPVISYALLYINVSLITTHKHRSEFAKLPMHLSAKSRGVRNSLNCA